MSNVDRAAHLITHKARGTRDGITTAIPGGFELPGWSHVKRKPREIPMCQRRHEEERERLAGLPLNSIWTGSNFSPGHQSLPVFQAVRGGAGGWVFSFFLECVMCICASVQKDRMRGLKMRGSRPTPQTSPLPIIQNSAEYSSVSWFPFAPLIFIVIEAVQLKMSNCRRFPIAATGEERKKKRLWDQIPGSVRRVFRLVNKSG